MTTMVTGGRRVAFVGLLFAAMGAATLAAPSLGILATFIIDDLAISKSLLGWVIGTNIILAAVLSPLTGRVTDRVGGKAALIALLTLASIAFLTFGLAIAIGVLFVASGVAAVAQSGANPATNKLIGEHLPAGERGVTTGIKQSGVQAAITVAGLSLPTLAIAFGWRYAMVAVAALPLFGAVVAVWVIPHSGRDGSAPAGNGALPASTRWLAGYGFVFGFAGAVTFFIPLFAVESLGLDPRLGGLAVTVAAVVAFAARILWARHAEQRGEYLQPLGVMAVLGVLASVLLLMATTWPLLLWVGVAVTGASTSAWNSVGMLAVIDEAGAATGRASGVVLFGFLTGLGIGPPLYGATIDATGGYTAMWLISIGAAAATVVLVWVWRQRRGAS
jgi:MFS family permease